MNSPWTNFKYKSKDDGEILKKRSLQRKRSRSVPVHIQHSLPMSCATNFTKPTEVLNGFWAIVISNDIYFEGLFKNGRRHGPGVLTYINSMAQNVGWWQGKEILRLCRLICASNVPTISLHKSNNNDYNRLKNFNSNMSEILNAYYMLHTHSNGARIMAESSLPNDFDQLDLEGLLQYNFEVMVKRCVLLEKTSAADRGTFSTIANTEVMADLYKHTSDYLNEETSYNISNFVINARTDFGKAGVYESLCIDFLSACSNGDKMYFTRLTKNYDINVNICDGHGNVGLMYAAARDKIDLIMALAQMKANFNLINDDGLTPLSMVLLRFIALLRNINNWNAAFVNALNCDVEKVDLQPCDASKLVTFSDIVFNYHDKPLPDIQQRLKMSVEQVFTFYGLLLPAPTLQNFSRTYSYNSAHCSNCKDAFVFDLRLKKDNRPNDKRKLIQDARRINNDTFLRLTVIFNTFVALLHYGCNSCKGHRPLPPLFLGLFTESRDVIKMLLKFGADPHCRNKSYYNVTVLQALVSMRPGKYLVELAKALLTVDVDMDVRTDGNHWWEERLWVVGNYKEMLDTGKTALHILAMRADFPSSTTWMRQIAELLINKGASLSKRYLGHVPLTLAMMRGNVELVKTFLRKGANANEELGSKMGTPMSIYLLHRFKKQLPPYESCRSILHLLAIHGGDPLQKVANSVNVFEFLNTETEKHRAVRITAKRASFRRIVKVIKFTPFQLKIRSLLLSHARRRLKRHYESLIVLALYIGVKRGVSTSKNVALYLGLARFITFKRALQIVRYLMFMKVLDIGTELNYRVLYNLIMFLQDHGGRMPLKKKKDASVILKTLTPLKPKSWAPEFEVDFEKYRVCFTCCLKSKKQLLACPSCGLVLFCSRHCEQLGRQYKFHRCKGCFYKDEYAQYKFCHNHDIHYEGVHDEIFDNVHTILKNVIEH